MKSERVETALPLKGSLSRANDDSSVVSLKSLVARVEPALPAARKDSFDDSGLIDLNKLMASAPPSSGALPPVLAPNEAGLFAVPAAVPVAQAAPASSLPESARTDRSKSLGKWLLAGALTVLIAGGTLGAFYARTVRTAEVRHGEEVPTPVMTTEPTKFVEAPLAVETPAIEATAELTPEKKASDDGTTRRSRKAAAHTSPRERAREDSTPTKTATDGKKSMSSPSCDLMCEMGRRASATKKP